MQTTRRAPLTDPAPGTTALPRRVATLFVTAVVVVLLDQGSKAAVVATRAHRPPLRLLDGVLQIDLVRNAGAAFGLAAGATLVFTVVAVGVVVAIVRLAGRLRSRWWAVALGLLLGGAVGNLIDRLSRAPGPLRGRVVDWIDLRVWPVFNLADAAIVIGVVLAMLLLLRGLRVDGSRHRAPTG